MTKNRPRKFPEMMADQETSPLDNLIRRSKQLRGLSSLVSELLGPDLAAHCQLANIEGNTLILLVASTAWATRVRYQIPQLLQNFTRCEQLSHLTDIKVRISAQATAPVEEPPKRRASMSKEAAFCLRHCAESISDNRLSTALQHLAKRGAGKQHR